MATTIRTAAYAQTKLCKNPACRKKFKTDNRERYCSAQCRHDARAK